MISEYRREQINRVIKAYEATGDITKKDKLIKCSQILFATTPENGDWYINTPNVPAKTKLMKRDYCGVPFCPTCDKKKTAIRFRELYRKLVSLRKQTRFSPVFVTLTRRVKPEQSIKEAYRVLDAALKRMKEWRPFRNSILGSYFAFNLKWSEKSNGWHLFIQGILLLPQMSIKNSETEVIKETNNPCHINQGLLLKKWRSLLNKLDKDNGPLNGGVRLERAYAVKNATRTISNFCTRKIYTNNIPENKLPELLAWRTNKNLRRVWGILVGRNLRKEISLLEANYENILKRYCKNGNKIIPLWPKTIKLIKASKKEASIRKGDKEIYVNSVTGETADYRTVINKAIWIQK